MYGFNILCEILKDTFEISHKILNPYNAKCAFYCLHFFACDLRYLWIVTSYVLVRRAPDDSVDTLDLADCLVCAVHWFYANDVAVTVRWDIYR